MKKSHVSILMSVLIGASLMLAFHPTVEKLLVRWSEGDDNYCYMIVPLFLYLCWEKRHDFQFRQFSWNARGFIVLLGAMATALVGELGSVETILYLGLWGTSVGIGSVLYGGRIKLLMFPFLILLFIVPLPPFINRVLTFEMKMLASTLAVKVLRVFGLSVFQDGNVIDFGVGKLEIVEACSGMRYLLPMVLMSLLAGHFFLKGKGSKLFLTVLAVPFSILVNVTRIVVTGLLLDKGYPHLTEGWFHDLTGWVLFMGAAGLLVLASLVLRKMLRHPTALASRDPGGAEGSLQKTLLYPLTICLILLSGGWLLREVPHQFAAPPRTSFAHFPLTVDGWTGERHFLSADISGNLAADDYISATFRKPNQNNEIYLLVPYYTYQNTRHTAHAPQSCLLGNGWNLVQSLDRPIPLRSREDLVIRELVMEKSQARVLATYFFLQRGRIVLNPWMNKFYLIWDALTRKRTDGALVRVEMTWPPHQSLEEIRQNLDRFLLALWEVLPNYVPS